jgi:hypothetical protein
MAGRAQLGIACAAAVAAFALLLAGPARAQGVAAPEVILGGHLYPRPFGLTYAYGQVRVPDGTPPGAVAGQTVDLYASTFPFTGWVPVASLTTDWKGYFTYHQRINQNVAFRAVWNMGGTPVQSKDKLVKLPLRLRLRVSRRGARRVIFRGVSYPPHPGGRIYLQQLGGHGRFRTVTSTTIASGSSFSRSWRLRRPGVFRALFPGDGQFGEAASRPVRVAGP